MHVAVTGASSGIGEAIAREFARAGASLTVVARRTELLEKLAKDCAPSKVRVVSQDLSKPEIAADWIAGAEAELGPIDVLVNNAGLENSGPTASSDIATGMRVLSLNMLSPILITRAILPKMIERKRGTIVNVASLAAYSPMPRMAWYAASKAGIAHFTETLRPELKKTGVHAVVVYPGPVKTAMADQAYETFGGRKGIVGMAPEGTPEGLARLVRRAVERRRARVIYPRSYFAARLVPWLGMWLTSLTPLPPPKQP